MLRIAIMILALGSGGGAAWIVAQDRTTAVPTADASAADRSVTVDILVAAAPIARGARLTPEMLTWRSWPESAVGAGLVSREGQPDPAALTGRIATRAFAADEPMRMDALSEVANGYLAALLSPGMRAVAISTSAQSSAGGFILPDDRVDVLHTFPIENPDGSVRRSSRTLLEGVRVLAIDQTTGGTEQDPVVGKTATLELTQRQAEVLTAAQATGELSLSLRPLTETAPGPEAAVTLAAANTAAAEQTARTVRIFRPGRVETLVLN